MRTGMTLRWAVVWWAALGALAQANPLGKDDLKRFWHDALPARAAPPRDTLTLHSEVLTRAEPDECFTGVGQPSPSVPCNVGQPKINHEYLFSMVKHGATIWFGTSANQFCTVLGTYLATIRQMMDLPAFPLETGSFVCEFDFSHFRQWFVPTNPHLPQLPGALGDWRPPKIYSFNLGTKIRTDRTPADPLIQDTLGIRAAGSLGNIVIMGGPNLIASFYQGPLAAHGGINLFAYRADTGAYLGSKVFTNYLDIRKWVVVDDRLYTAVRHRNGTGRVLKWTGDPAATHIDDLLRFEEVGRLDAEGAELACHEGRLFVTTWATPTDLPTSGVYMSPPVPAGGLTAAHLNGWKKIWSAQDYDPDPVVAKSYFMGAVASHDGYVYWGTINFPLVSFLTHMMVYQPTETNAIVEAFVGSFRNISIFRAKGFDGNPVQPDVEVVIGMDMLPAYTPATGWTLQTNKTGAVRFGLSGFGNLFNAYTWTMAPYNGDLYVGTMDWSYMLFDVGEMLMESLMESGEEYPEEILAFLQSFLEELPEELEMDPMQSMLFGGDLWRFPGSESPPIPESLNGLGNCANYGLRNMFAADGLYVGTANFANLMADAGEMPCGGWELIKLTPGAPSIPAVSGAGLAIMGVVVLGLGLWALRKRTANVPMG